MASSMLQTMPGFILITMRVVCVVLSLCVLVLPSSAYDDCPVNHPCYCTANTIYCNNQHIERIPRFRPSSKSWLELDLSYNNIKEIKSHAFAGLRIERLYLYFNKITRIHEDAFAGISNLKWLEVSNNRLKRIQRFLLQPVSGLRNLDLSYNQITTLDDEAFNWTDQLIELFLDGNNLTHIPVRALRPLQRLQLLSMRANNLSFIPAFAFANLPLQVLNLGHSKSAMSLSKNAFCGLEPRTTYKPKNITVWTGMFELNLNQNGIKVADLCSLRKIWTLEKLNLEDNPIHCNCQVYFFKKLGKADMGTSRCASPRGLEGNFVKYLELGKYLNCSEQGMREECNNYCDPTYSDPPMQTDSPSKHLVVSSTRNFSGKPKSRNASARFSSSIAVVVLSVFICMFALSHNNFL